VTGPSRVRTASEYASPGAVSAIAGHDAGTAVAQGPADAPGEDVGAAAAAAGRILVSLDVGLADIRAYPPGTHARIVVLRVPEQSAATVTSAAPSHGWVLRDAPGQILPSSCSVRVEVALPGALYAAGRWPGRLGAGFPRVGELAGLGGA
jgi:hypothetical protein